MKKIIKHKIAFSLIELSVVILVIGIIATGIVKGSRIIQSAKISAAKALTKSSPVPAIAGLILWLEPTSERAFQSSTGSFAVSNNDSITVWNDFNPTATSGFRATESSKPPSLLMNGIGGLPTLSFVSSDGSASNGQYLTIPFNVGLNPPTFTLFVVTRNVSDTSSYPSIVVHSLDNVADTGYIIYKVVDHRWVASYGLGSPGFGVYSYYDLEATSYSPVILTSFNNGIVGQLYENNSMVASNSTAGYVPNTTSDFRIGWSAFTNSGYTGYISEIILYNRALKSLEITAVNEYLSKKYNIKLF